MILVVYETLYFIRYSACIGVSVIRTTTTILWYMILSVHKERWRIVCLLCEDLRALIRQVQKVAFIIRIEFVGSHTAKLVYETLRKMKGRFSDSKIDHSMLPILEVRKIPEHPGSPHTSRPIAHSPT